jgi:flagellin
MSVINTNVKALYTQNALKASGRDSSVAMQQLSTGKRINSAKDDAAGLAISKRMTQQIRSLDMAIRNAGDAVALIQTAEGATSSITDMLQRMRELSIQAINDTNAQDQRGYLDLEFQQLKQQIQTITEQTQWNGFAILNGTAGESVGAKPIYKAISTGTFKDEVTYAASTPTTSEENNTVEIDEPSRFLKSGSLSVTFGSGPEISAATYTLDDGRTITLDASDSDVIEFSDNEITLKSGSGLVSGNVVLTQKLTEDDTSVNYDDGHIVGLRVVRNFPTEAAMQADDIVINGKTIPVSSANDDTVSAGASVAASAIARVVAINQMTDLTGVTAVVNPNIMSGAAMQSSAVMTGTISINGFTTPEIETSLNNLSESREKVTQAINFISEKPGVRAINSGSDALGIQLVANDGRNIELGFNTSQTAANFSAATGLRQGLQIGSYSLTSAVEGAMNITTNGDWNRSGLRPGDYSTNTSVVSSMTRPVVDDVNNIQTLGGDDLKINGVTIRGALSADDTLSSVLTETSSRASSAIAIAAAINASSAATGVTAIAGPASTLATSGPTVVSSESARLYLNGTSVAIELEADESATTRLNNIIEAINAQTGQHGVTASAADGKLKLDTIDGRNLSVWTSTDAAELGLTGTSATIDSSASSTFTGAKTVYGSVSLKSDQPFTLGAGKNGFGTEGDFSTLGFQEGTFGGEAPEGESQASRTGRLSFHVGANAEQSLSIDLADFGSKGPITGEITGDVALAGSEQRVNRIDSSENAKQMLGKLDRVLDRVNGNRAMMGAVMNRLEYVIENLSNVSLNTEASRSQIEDADYAKASTELARTQIMQQAATSVLAQANMDQQTVLKLLQ